jgi:aryl-alcohol dehydrogenase-like predicted oxidoreductase
MFSGSATPEGSDRLAARFPAARAAGFYRDAQGLTVSSIGIGTYLGEMDAATDGGYTEAVLAALDGGVNFIDTSLNYRNQRSERSIGAALNEAIGRERFARDEIVVCTKAGYLVPDAFPDDSLAPSDIAGGMHSMAPAFLLDQMKRSRDNLGLETLDVVYLHNPETQLAHVSAEQFHARIREAFLFLEAAAQAGDIRFYGAATWNGFRQKPGAPDGLSLGRLAGIAKSIAGERHRFRFIQLPLNFAMPEAYAARVDDRSLLDDAQDLGITVVASASLLQARLARDLPEAFAEQFTGAATDAQRAIQFTRSTPGIAVALVGMSQAAHVRENLALAATPPMSGQQYRGLYK